MDPCAISGCDRQGRRVRGWCLYHWDRWHKTGDPLGTNRKTQSERFWEKVNRLPDEGCWLWTGATLGTTGYGHFNLGARGEGTIVAHRYAYQDAVGPIPDGLHLDHLCRVRLCVNPAHLEPVTIAENNARALLHRSSVVRCINGHEYTPENTLMSKGSRRCKTCHRQAVARYRQKLTTSD